jgi:hypothetical protein
LKTENSEITQEEMKSELISVEVGGLDNEHPLLNLQNLKSSKNSSIKNV